MELYFVQLNCGIHDKNHKMFMMKIIHLIWDDEESRFLLFLPWLIWTTILLFMLPALAEVTGTCHYYHAEWSKKTLVQKIRSSCVT
jgi:hypothetical protein